MKSKALAIKSNNEVMRPEEFTSAWGEVKKVAEEICKSGLVPTSMNTPEKLTVVMMSARELGIPMMMATRTLFVVDQKVSMMSQAMLAKIYQSGLAEEVKIVDRADGKGCDVTMKRQGIPAHTAAFTIADAQKAGLLYKDNWKKYPEAMCQSRAISKCARAMFPDVIGGLYTPDEIQDQLPSQEAAIDVQIAAEKTTEEGYKDSRDVLFEDLESALDSMEKPGDVSKWEKTHEKEIGSLLDHDRETVKGKLDAKYQELVTGNPTDPQKPDATAYQRYLEEAKKAKDVDSLLKWFKTNKVDIEKALLPTEYTKLLDELKQLKSDIFKAEMDKKQEDSVQVAAKIFDELQAIDDKAVFDKYVKDHKKDIDNLMPEQKEWIEQEIKNIRDLNLEG